MIGLIAALIVVVLAVGGFLLWKFVLSDSGDGDDNNDGGSSSSEVEGDGVVNEIVGDDNTGNAVVAPLPEGSGSSSDSPVVTPVVPEPQPQEISIVGNWSGSVAMSTAFAGCPDIAVSVTFTDSTMTLYHDPASVRAFYEAVIELNGGDASQLDTAVDQFLEGFNISVSYELTEDGVLYLEDTKYAVVDTLTADTLVYIDNSNVAYNLSR